MIITITPLSLTKKPKIQSIQRKENPAMETDSSMHLSNAEEEQLRRETLTLMHKYDNELTSVQETQDQLMDLSKLMNTFSTKVFDQELTTEQSNHLL